MGASLPPVMPLKITAAADFGLMELPSASGLRAQLLPSGALFALRHQDTLINQLLPGPAEDGLFRLLLRWRNAAGTGHSTPLVGPTVGFTFLDATATWTTATPDGLECVTTLQLHPQHTAWAWRVTVRNRGTAAQTIDVLHAQDLGLADEGAVRNNEAYVSQYLDLLPVTDPVFGPVILARQNQPMAGGRRPWLALACAEGAAAYCTDGWQFFGADHRLTGEPAAVRAATLPSHRLQYEFALGGLQSHRRELAPGACTEVVFLARYSPDHPAASGAGDLALLRELLPLAWLKPAATAPAIAPARSMASVFTSAPWLHGRRPEAAHLADWYPAPRRHQETDARGQLLSFFHGAETHVALRDKEATIARPHGHILRSGEAAWNDDQQFGLTCYAAGIFGAQSYLGNPSLARLLTVVRNHLNVTRAGGQRVFLREGEAWHQLGVPSVFAMEPGTVRWLYQLGPRTIEVRAWCSGRDPASFLQLRVLAGPPAEFLVTHQLALGAVEFESGGDIEVHEDGWIAARPAGGSFSARHLPGTCFALAAAVPATLAAHGGDELIYADAIARQGPYVAFQTKPVESCAFIMLGSTRGPSSLAECVARARAEYATGLAPARAPAAGLRLHGSADAGTGRLDEILPWFAHNAGIHFSAPHGLEQSGGAAWGVRDVCQGSVEWLLAAGEFSTVRRILTTVFEQQYAHHPDEPAVEGCWPQWFMFAPFHFIQQTHSHGDVCFWPVKALCDYVEASHDLAFLQTTLGYTDPVKFTPNGLTDSLWDHCDRVIAHCEARFVPGTALVNYGDGDWDDTLQPADPAMRTRMISAWTVALAYHTFRQFAEVSRRAGETARALRLDRLLVRMRGDFARLALPDGVVAGFLVHEADGRFRALLHPTDRVTGIRYRLLPMTRSILAELFTPEEARQHAALIESELRFTDGVRLMSEPAVYHGGIETLFKRADTAANVGREIGLQYVHAHIRYAEAMAKLGDADRLWQALQVVNPVGLERVVPGALARQSNVYFSSSDADFSDRLEAAARWPELRAGRVPVRAGWRLYSSGPGLYLNKVRACLLGLRESFGDVVFDPVLPRSLDGLQADSHLLGRPVRLTYRVRTANHSPSMITVNGHVLSPLTREPNPYRDGGVRVAGSVLANLLQPGDNQIEIVL